MDFSALVSGITGAFNGVLLDDLLVWGVALAAGVVALVALANAVEMLIDTEAG
jgi:hypothetical protein